MSKYDIPAPTVEWIIKEYKKLNDDNKKSFIEFLKYLISFGGDWVKISKKNMRQIGSKLNKPEKIHNSKVFYIKAQDWANIKHYFNDDDDD